MSSPSVNLTISQGTLASFVPAKELEEILRGAEVRSVADRVFYLMPLVIGVPQLALNLYVVSSVLLVTACRSRWVGKAAAAGAANHNNAASLSRRESGCSVSVSGGVGGAGGATVAGVLPRSDYYS